jgi:hypothetical protein
MHNHSLPAQIRLLVLAAAAAALTSVNDVVLHLSFPASLSIISVNDTKCAQTFGCVEGVLGALGYVCGGHALGEVPICKPQDICP